MLAILAVAAVLPGLLPGSEAYLDNPTHLLELHSLAWEVLPRDRWFTGWSGLAEAGMAVGQLNAPLAWLPLAALMRAGLPIVPLYLACIALSNVVFALGTYRLGRRLFRDPFAAFAGSAIATLWAPDLFGLAGAAAGMWPFRLAIGVLVWGMASAAPRIGRAAAWASGVFLLHTYVGLVAFAWVALSALAEVARGRRGLAGRWVAVGATALALAAFFWVPLLDGDLRTFSAKIWPAGFFLATLALPLKVAELEAKHAIFWFADGLLLPFALLIYAGVALAIRRRPPLADRELALRLAAATGALAVLLLVVVPLTGWLGLGPNPWRYLVFLRVPLYLAAGAGLATLPFRRAALATVAAVALAAASYAGLQEVPHHLGARNRAAWADIEAIWADVARLAPPGRVYHEDPTFDTAAPEAFQRSHVGALLPIRSGLPIVGTWYGVTPIPTHGWTNSEGQATLGRWPGGVEANADALVARLRLFGIGSVVTTTDRFARLLAARSDCRPISRRGPFALFVLEGDVLPALGVAPTAGTVTVESSRPGHHVADVHLSGGAAPIRLRESWHPWWRATLDGQPLVVEHDPTNGMGTLTAPASGRLEVWWELRRGPGAVVSVLGLVALLFAFTWDRRRR